jgi:hypothetical protein
MIRSSFPFFKLPVIQGAAVLEPRTPTTRGEGFHEFQNLGGTKCPELVMSKNNFSKESFGIPSLPPEDRRPHLPLDAMKDNVVAFLHALQDRQQDILDVSLVLPAITNNNCGGDQPKHGNITTQWCIKARSVRIESKLTQKTRPPHPQIPGRLARGTDGIVMQHHKIKGMTMFGNAQIKTVSPKRNLIYSIQKVL